MQFGLQLGDLLGFEIEFLIVKHVFVCRTGLGGIHGRICRLDKLIETRAMSRGCSYSGTRRQGNQAVVVGDVAGEDFEDALDHPLDQQGIHIGVDKDHKFVPAKAR